MRERSHEVHVEMKQFECKICDKRFTQKFSLNQSMRERSHEVHEGMKQFECKICDKRFTQKFSLNVHIASITKAGAPEEVEVAIKYL